MLLSPQAGLQTTPEAGSGGPQGTDCLSGSHRNRRRPDLMPVLRVDERSKRGPFLAWKACRHAAPGQRSRGKEERVHPALLPPLCNSQFPLTRTRAQPLSGAALTLRISSPFSSPEARIQACLTAASSLGPFQPPPSLSSSLLLPSPAPLHQPGLKTVPIPESSRWFREGRSVLRRTRRSCR